MSVERNSPLETQDEPGVTYGRSENGEMVVMAGGEIVSVLDRDTVALFFNGDETLAELDEAPLVSTEGFNA